VATLATRWPTLQSETIEIWPISGFCLHFYFRFTSDDIEVGTIEKLDLENMVIAVGIAFLGSLELEIWANFHFGGINPSPPPGGIATPI